MNKYRMLYFLELSVILYVFKIISGLRILPLPVLTGSGKLKRVHGNSEQVTSKYQQK